MAEYEESVEYHSPTHVQVTVFSAKGLVCKGKHDTNSPFAIIELGKDKFSTSVQEGQMEPVWNEECMLKIPNLDSSIEIQVMHKSSGHDRFLGRAEFPLAELDFNAIPKPKWYFLHPRKGKEKSQGLESRGKIQVQFVFVVQEEDEADPKKKKHKLFSSLKKVVPKSVRQLAHKGSIKLKKSSHLSASSLSLASQKSDDSTYTITSDHSSVPQTQKAGTNTVKGLLPSDDHYSGDSQHDSLHPTPTTTSSSSSHDQKRLQPSQKEEAFHRNSSKDDSVSRTVSMQSGMKPSTTHKSFDQFGYMSKEQLISTARQQHKAIETQQKVIEERDSEIKSLKAYIDNMIVKIIDTNPEILMNLHNSE